MTKSSKSTIDPAAFVRVWQRAGSRAEVAEKLGISLQRVEAFATRLRKRGVKLRVFTKSGANSIDPVALNRLIEELDGQPADGDGRASALAELDRLAKDG